MPTQVNVRFATKRRRISFNRQYSPTPLTVLHRAVVGIHVQGKPLLNFPKEMRDGTDPRVDTRLVPLRAAQRLHEFVEMHYVQGSINFNCFSFMRFITGLDDDSFYHTSIRHSYYGNIALPAGIVPYEPYVMSRQGTPLHGIVGFTRTVGFSVLGINQPLTMAPIPELLALYEADRMIKVDDLEEYSH